VTRIGFEQFEAIAAGSALERVAALVVAPGFGELPAILKRLAEREGEVDAVDRRGRGRVLPLAHPRDLVVGEAVELEVGLLQ